MPVHALRGLLAAAAILAALPAGAQAVSGACELPAAQADPLRDRAGLLAAYGRMPRHCLQELVTACTRASNRGLLDFGSAAVCSFGYEALLHQGFGGDFGALMAWWSSQRDQALH